MTKSKKILASALLLCLTLLFATGCEKLSLRNLTGDWDFAGDSFASVETDCFAFVYPIQMTVGEEARTFNNAQELDQFCEEIANAGDDTPEPAFVYPLDIIRTGQEAPTTLNRDEEMDEVFAECYGSDCEDDENESGGDDPGDV